MPSGYLYLTAVIDWFSRHVLAWRLSNSMDVEFCIEALNEALSQGRPEIFNTDQGSQFTSQEFTGRLLAESIQISMDGKGRAIDNVMVERLWRSVKYEEIYLKSYENGTDCDAGLKAYFHYYTHDSPHQSLNNQTPWEAFQTAL
jgi:putative transposase